MRGVVKLECESYKAEAAIKKCDLVFMARDKGWAMNEAARLLNGGLKIVDLSADFRLRDPLVYEEWYNLAHTATELLNEAVFGLPELYHDQIADARLIANPGCYVTGAILALAPLLKNEIINPGSIIVDAKSGVSGAGRSSYKRDYHFPELNENVKAYNIGAHRHTPEIEQELSALADQDLNISFTPHLIPITRGILTTAYADVTAQVVSTESLTEIYREFYKTSPFVVILDPGEYPATKSTVGSNFCQIGMKFDPRTDRVVVVSAIDNLMKGAAGQAVQNMNLMAGFDETAGLMYPGVCA